MAPETAPQAPNWWRLVVAAAAIKSVAAIGVVAVGSGHGPPGLYSPYQYALLVFAFATTGLVLVAARTADQRAVWLGCILVLTAAPLAEVILAWSAPANPSVGPFLRVLERTPVVPLVPVFCWLFVRQFPDEVTSRTGRRVLWAGTAVSTAIAVLLIASNLSQLLWPARSAGFQDPRALLSARSNASIYWPLIMAAALGAFGVLAWHTRRADRGERRRARIFVAGLLLGFLPVCTTVLLETLSPAYARVVAGPAGDWIAQVVFVSLAAVPLVTAYSVLVDRVVEIRLVVRSALQYALAKYTLLAIVMLPLAGMAWYLYGHRSRTVLELVSGSGILLLGATALAAAIMLRTRHRALSALDRRFFREQYDARRILNDLVDRCGKSSTIDDLISLVCGEIDRALHLDDITLLVATADGSMLRGADARIRPLSMSSGLAFLAEGDSAPFAVDLARADSMLRRLPAEERAWLADSGFALLVPLNGADGSLLGLMGLGHKLSELPFSREDRLLLQAIGASVALTIENRQLRKSTSSALRQPRSPDVQPTLRTDGTRPARECDACGRIYPPETGDCDCGSELMAALVPYVLAGKFQVDRRLGRGGMGVVYRALDTSLGRHVALKTLPRVGPDDAARLRHEAKAMAAVQHENLSVIFGAETWLDTPILVVELLVGGTLADRLRKGPIPCAQALDIGIALTRGVERLHRAGVLHCDIKPSNIGFTRDAVPKLLDFGLATVLQPRPATSTTTTRSASTAERFGVATSVEDEEMRFAGTPRYMSPEALAGQPRQQASDIWSLTVVLFEMIAGAPPFNGASVQAIVDAIVLGAATDIRTYCPACPSSVRGFFTRALSPRSEDRPQTALHLARELAGLRSGVG